MFQHVCCCVKQNASILLPCGERGNEKRAPRAASPLASKRIDLPTHPVFPGQRLRPFGHVQFAVRTGEPSLLFVSISFFHCLFQHTHLWGEGWPRRSAKCLDPLHIEKKKKTNNKDRLYAWTAQKGEIAKNR